jgi:hypothetical protein
VRASRSFERDGLFVWLVTGCWCWFVLREKYCWLVGSDWFVPIEKYCWLVGSDWFVPREKYYRLVDDIKKSGHKLVCHISTRKGATTHHKIHSKRSEEYNSLLVPAIRSSYCINHLDAILYFEKKKRSPKKATFVLWIRNDQSFGAHSGRRVPWCRDGNFVYPLNALLAFEYKHTLFIYLFIYLFCKIRFLLVKVKCEHHFY